MRSTNIGYQGTKLQDIPVTLDDETIAKSKILIVTDTNQYLITFDKLVEILKRKLR